MTNLLTKPKHFVIRLRDANGHKQQFHLHDIVYMELIDMSKQETNKCVFKVDLNA